MVSFIYIYIFFRGGGISLFITLKKVLKKLESFARNGKFTLKISFW